MEPKNPQTESPNIDQLQKYAKDLAEVYQSKKEKAKELHTTKQQLFQYADDLNQIILELKTANQELQESYLDTIHRLVLAAEYKDEDTGDHIVRMSRYCAFIANKRGLTPMEVQHILYASPMHDIGKIGVPDNILMKPGKLTDEEFETMKTHTTIGAKILAHSKSEILKVAEQIGLYHHEKWNGTGYPHGLSGDTIPLTARIVALADTFDALTSKRPYKDPYPFEVAYNIIKKERSQHFDPAIVDVFLDNIDEILKIKHKTHSTGSLSLATVTTSDRDQSEGKNE